MSDDAQFQWQGDDVLLLSGHLDREHVPSLWRDLQAQPFAAGTVQCSLKAVTRVDSAAMALLIHVIKHAKQQKCHIMFSFIPPQLKTLLELSNADGVTAEHIQQN
ncbi:MULTISPECIES: lipid asymmetry maintenance protein MlaB [unclassified Vibrio]|uniref:STAS domain-containing protein n=1 Tax=Vibrio sp. HB236076 TaxID=3232307 RepID=A0AB39HFI0_9VIBR|nr:STAS domain-containing protein [Vibrio sp. HB161653]MDP5255495.1 STAS domain-containing protein [Vibrio sp. HB161653]